MAEAMNAYILVGNLRRQLFGDLSIDGKIILRSTLKK
jgi:hypothetical protein